MVTGKRIIQTAIAHGFDWKELITLWPYQPRPCIAGSSSERGLEWNDDPTSRPNSIVVDPLPARIGEIIGHFRNTFGVRPIIIGERISSWGGIQEVRQNLLSLDSKQFLEISLGSLTQNRVVLSAPATYIFFPVHNLLYVLGSLIYHCKNLAFSLLRHCKQGLANRKDD